MRNLRALVAAATLALTPALAQAQLITSTGQVQSGGRDTRWQLAYGLTGGTLGAFSDAFLITNPVWGTPTGASWIGAVASASVPGGSGDGSPRFTYVARTQFTLGAGETLTYKFQCGLDNFFIGLFVNGNQVTGNSCTFGALGTEFTLGSSNFTSGLNTIEFRYSGDGITDGIAIRSTSVTVTPGTPPTPGVVPEPSTYVLMATGLLGVFGVARRTRRAV